MLLCIYTLEENFIKVFLMNGFYFSMWELNIWDQQEEMEKDTWEKSRAFILVFI